MTDHDPLFHYRLVMQEDLNFLLTNRIPRQLLTRFIGWFSKIEQPLVRDAVHRDLEDVLRSRSGEAKKARFSQHARLLYPRTARGCTTGRSRPRGAGQSVRRDRRRVWPHRGHQLIQAKGFPYTLLDLLGDAELVEHYRNGRYVTLRITASMYHRFHAPHDLHGRAGELHLGRHLECESDCARSGSKNCSARTSAPWSTPGSDPGGHLVTLVPVAAVLVASIRLHFLDVLLHLKYRGPNVMPCDAAVEQG